jgi:hypothetical protein
LHHAALYSFFIWFLFELLQTKHLPSNIYITLGTKNR